MKKLVLFCVVIATCSSCGLDRNTISSALYLQYTNQASRNISVVIFPISNYYGYDTLWFSLASGENFTSESYRSDDVEKSPGVFDTFVPEMYGIFQFVDSAGVVFSDSLLVTHYSRVIPYDSLSSPSDPIYYQQPRNIFNFENYSIEKINESDFKATYIFTESDLNYADSIHE